MKRKLRLNLPKGYLSYSATMLWQKNKDLFRKRYYENEKQEESIPMRFGKKIAEVLESRNFKEFPTLKKVPYYPISEHKIEVDIGGVPVLAFLDLYKPKTFSFGEVKTGSVSYKNGPPWDRVKVKFHDQLPWYSLLIESVYGKVDPVCHLIWVETRYKTVIDQIGSRKMEGESKELELTGRIEVFKRRIAKWERERIKKMIIKTAKEVTRDYNAYQKRNKRSDVGPGKKVLEKAQIATELGVFQKTPVERSAKTLGK